MAEEFIDEIGKQLNNFLPTIQNALQIDGVTDSHQGVNFNDAVLYLAAAYALKTAARGMFARQREKLASNYEALARKKVTAFWLQCRDNKLIMKRKNPDSDTDFEREQNWFATAPKDQAVDAFLKRLELPLKAMAPALMDGVVQARRNAEAGNAPDRRNTRADLDSTAVWEGFSRDTDSGTPEADPYEVPEAVEVSSPYRDEELQKRNAEEFHAQIEVIAQLLGEGKDSEAAEKAEDLEDFMKASGSADQDITKVQILAEAGRKLAPPPPLEELYPPPPLEEYTGTEPPPLPPRPVNDDVVIGEIPPAPVPSLDEVDVPPMPRPTPPPQPPRNYPDAPPPMLEDDDVPPPPVPSRGPLGALSSAQIKKYVQTKVMRVTRLLIADRIEEADAEAAKLSEAVNNAGPGVPSLSKEKILRSAGNAAKKQKSSSKNAAPPVVRSDRSRAQDSEAPDLSGMATKVEWDKVGKVYGFDEDEQKSAKTLARHVARDGRGSAKAESLAKEMLNKRKSNSSGVKFKNHKHLLGAVEHAMDMKRQGKTPSRPLRASEIEDDA